MSTPETNPYAPASFDPEPPRKKPEPPALDATLGQRIGGGVMVLNGALGLLSVALSAAAPGIAPSTGIVSSVIDLAIGTSLLRRQKRFVPWAVVRLTLGLVVYTLMQLGNPMMVVFQVVVCTSMLLLIVGNASKARIAAGAVLYGLFTLVALLGLVTTVAGSNPLGPAILAARGEVERQPVERLTGVAYPYTLDLPGGRWHLRTADAARRDQPLADRWAVRPDKDAHLLVVVEKVPGRTLHREPYTDAALGAQQQSTKGLSVIDRGPLPSDPDAGRLVHLTFTVGGIEFERWAGFVTTGEMGFQILATAPRKVFPEIASELRAIVDSFKVPSEAFLAGDRAADPTPAGTVTGVAYGYQLTAPSARWHLRDAAVARRDQPLADRWLTRPDRAASVIVIAEHVPGSKLTVDAFTDAVLESVKQRAVKMDVVERRPLRSDPARGRFVHLTATMENLELDYVYGLVTEGERAFQIMAFVEHIGYSGVEAELTQVVESFRLP